MREITETHIIELIKKYAQGGSGGDLLDYFAKLGHRDRGEYNLAFAHNGKLIAGEIYMTLLSVTGSGRYRTYTFEINYGGILDAVSDDMGTSGSLPNSIPNGWECFVAFPVVDAMDDFDVITSIYPITAFGDRSEPCGIMIPPSDMSWTIPDAVTGDDIIVNAGRGSLLSSYYPQYPTTGAELMDVVGQHCDPIYDEYDTQCDHHIRDAMTVTYVPHDDVLDTWPTMDIKIDNTTYTVPNGSIKCRMVKFTFNKTLTLSDPDEGIYTADGETYSTVLGKIEYVK